MKTIFDKTTRDELVDRIGSLTENSTAQWGKMNIYEMLKHCMLFDEMVLGKTKHKRAFLGLLFGKVALKSALKDGEPLRRNTPTLSALKPKAMQNSSISDEKKKWIGLMGEYADFSNPSFIHPFFGKITMEQVGNLVYKHTDHHLRQFNS